VRLLESRFGAALFLRRAKGVALTEAGAAYLPAVRRALDDLSAATAGLFGAPAPRRVTLRCAVSFAGERLAPALAAFLAENPDVSLRLFSAIWSDALDDSAVDLEIRYGHGRWSGFDAWALSPPRSVPVCPPDAPLEGDPATALAAQMARGLIHITGCETLWRDMARAIGAPDALAEGGITVDTSLSALALTAAGAGSAVIAADLAAPWIADGRVRAPAGLTLPRDETYHLLQPRRPTPPQPDAVRLRDWLLDAFSGGRAGAAGDPAA
jgi:LysR family glycine cleavage system transcriptional activator